MKDSDTGIAWIDGSVVAAGEARVALMDRGFQYGDGVFETVRAEGGKAFFLKEHLARMASGLVVLGIDCPDAEARARAGLGAVLKELGEPGRDAATLKVIVTRGSGPPGPSTRGDFRTSVIVTGRLDAHGRPRSVRAITSSIVRNERSPLARVKSLNYLDMILARREAERAGADEGVVLNTHGRVAEGSAANVFVVQDVGGSKRLVTPPVDEGCLPGIVRAQVIEIARARSFDVAEGPLSIEALRGADEAFLTNSRIGLVPLVELDGRPVGTGSAGGEAEALAGVLRAAELASAEEP